MSMKIDYCYHTHTYRCGHASGKDEEYVLAAIESGIKVLGFTDHVMLPGYPQPGIRGDFALLQDYIDSINSLKEKYKDKIEIHLGFECEYYPQFVDYYKELKEKYGIEYLILGQHCFINERNEFQWHMCSDTKENVDRYVHYLIKGMESGLFAYVAHPDLFITAFDEWQPYMDEASESICEAAVKYNIPLEINLGRFNRGNMFFNHLMYPDLRFFRIAAKHGCKVIVGRDAHNPRHLLETHFDFAEKIIKELGLKAISII